MNDVPGNADPRRVPIGIMGTLGAAVSIYKDLSVRFIQLILWVYIPSAWALDAFMKYLVPQESDWGIVIIFFYIFAVMIVHSLSLIFCTYFVKTYLETGIVAEWEGARAWLQTCYGSVLNSSIRVTVTVFLWSLLFVIPGIVAFMKYWAAPNVRAWRYGDLSEDSKMVSRELMTGQRLRFFFLFCLLSIPGLVVELVIPFTGLGETSAILLKGALQAGLTNFFDVVCVVFFAALIGVLKPVEANETSAQPGQS